MNAWFRLSLAAVATILAMLAPASAAAAERLALVIGNTDYDTNGTVAPLTTEPTAEPARTRFLSDLQNPRSDADLIADTLTAEGFDVDRRYDLDRSELENALKSFSARVADASPDAKAIIYFAGHGIQIENRQFLIPVGAEVSREGVPFYGRAGEIVQDFVPVDVFRYPDRTDGDGWTLIVLDACRENPWPSLAVRGIRDPDASPNGPAKYLTVFGSGHPKIGPRGMLYLAAEPGELASDGADGNSPVARALADALARESSIEAALAATRREVRMQTDDLQIPHLYRGENLTPCGEDCEGSGIISIPAGGHEALASARNALEDAKNAIAGWRDGSKAHQRAELANIERREILLDQFSSLPAGESKLDIWEYYQEGGLYASFTGWSDEGLAGRYRRRCSVWFLRERCPTPFLAEVIGARGAGETWRGQLLDLLSGNRSWGQIDIEGRLVSGMRFKGDGSIELGVFERSRLVRGLVWFDPDQCPRIVEGGSAGRVLPCFWNMGPA